MPSPLIAIAQSVGPIRVALTTILGDALTNGKLGAGPVVGVAIATDADGADWADKSIAILKQHPACVGLVVVTPKPPIFEKLAPRLQAAFNAGFKVVDSATPNCLLARILQSVSEFAKRPASISTMHMVREMTFAAALYHNIRNFSHGATRDITNQVLAPWRLLLEAGVDFQTLNAWTSNAKNLLAKFKNEVVDKRDPEWWLSAELSAAFARLPTDVGSWQSKGHDADLSRLMDILTECRVLAGAESSTASTTTGEANPIPAPESKQNWPYKILVIDDHAEAWRPVFQKVQTDLAAAALSALPAEFTFRTGGEADLAEARVQTDKKNAEQLAASVVLPQITDQDAVLLDVNLPYPLKGITLLEEVRRHSVNVPIIVWTSSRAPELPAEAQLAHGFLFKKTATLDAITKMIRSRLTEGNAKRHYPLPGHFFDHSLCDRANRKAALRMAEYCSKQMDSFHALDDNYFRTFTDHGGRHLFKLVEHLGDTLRHLSALPDFFSQDPVDREEEILALYLAVFLHEFGMLRLNGPHEPQWEKLVRRASKAISGCSRRTLERELALVRALHAVRGMVLLAKEPPADAEKNTDWHWPDEEGCHQSRKRMWKDRSPYVHAAVALITGHHSRLLPLDIERKSKTWNHRFDETYTKKAGAALKLSGDKLSRHLHRRFYSPPEVDRTLTELLGIIGNGRLERVRKHCAVFRFVDAIDVDQSRNPARFLCRIGILSRFDRRETLKRQVIRHVRIEGGRVSMETNVPAPALEVVREVWAAKEKKAGDLAAFQQLEAWISDPWGKVAKDEDIDSPEKCHKAIDDWLEAFWDKPERATASFLDFSDAEKSRASKIQIASLTALSVAGEILSEYRAIFQCELENFISLGRFWRDKPDPQDWASHQEKMLSILFHPEDGLDSLLR